MRRSAELRDGSTELWSPRWGRLSGRRPPRRKRQDPPRRSRPCMSELWAGAALGRPHLIDAAASALDDLADRHPEADAGLYGQGLMVLVRAGLVERRAWAGRTRPGRTAVSRADRRIRCRRAADRSLPVRLARSCCRGAQPIGPRRPRSRGGRRSSGAPGKPSASIQSTPVTNRG